MILIICISGDGGGSSGPDNCYQILKQLYDPSVYHVVPIDTYPNNTSKNVKYVCNQLSICHDTYQKIYIIGWSLGTVTAIDIAHQLNCTYISGLILISPIRHYMEHFDQVIIPIGYIHGKLDTITSYQNSYHWFHRTPSHKLIHIHDQCDHLFTGHGYNLAIDIVNILSQLDQLIFPTYYNQMEFC